MKYFFRLAIFILLFSCLPQTNNEFNQIDTKEILPDSLTFEDAAIDNNAHINSSVDSLKTKDTIEIITQLRSPFLEESIKINDSTSLLIYNGADLINSTQSLAICSYTNNSIKLIIKSEILNKQIINTSKGPNRTIFIPGSVGKDGYVINHDDLTFEEIEFSDYDGSEYLEKIKTRIFPVALITIYTDSLVRNYKITTETDPDNLPW